MRFFCDPRPIHLRYHTTSSEYHVDLIPKTIQRLLPKGVISTGPPLAIEEVCE
jgi:hypothetical protein